MARKLHDFFRADDGRAQTARVASTGDLLSQLRRLRVPTFKPSGKIPAKRTGLLAARFRTLHDIASATDEELATVLCATLHEKVAAYCRGYFASPKGRSAVATLARDASFLEQLKELRIPFVSDDDKILQEYGPLLDEQFEGIRSLARAAETEIADALRPETRIAESVFDFFHNSGGKRLISELKAVGVNMTQARRRPTRHSSALEGKTVVVTGTLEKYSRKEIEDLIKRLGGKVVSSVSKTTNFVVCGSSPGSKLQRARALKVEVIDEADFLRRIARI